MNDMVDVMQGSEQSCQQIFRRTAFALVIKEGNQGQGHCQGRQPQIFSVYFRPALFVDKFSKL